MLILSAIGLSDVPMVSSKYGLVPKGSVLSYQQKLESGCLVNLYGEALYPYLPRHNVMCNDLSIALNNKQSVTMEGIQLSMEEIK